MRCPRCELAPVADRAAGEDIIADTSGTGLALATVYGIVKQSGGFIWVYSELGQGTTFKVYLPHSAGNAASGAAVEVTPSPVRKKTILLVEDEDAVRRLTRRVLSRQGYSVIEARDGIEAMALVDQREDRIDLVLTDVVMPKLNGSDLAVKVRSRYPDLRVIYMSGYTDDDIVRPGLPDPTMVFIQKPFTPDVLTRKVREVLDAASRSAPVPQAASKATDAAKIRASQGRGWHGSTMSDASANTSRFGPRRMELISLQASLSESIMMAPIPSLATRQPRGLHAMGRESVSRGCFWRPIVVYRALLLA